ncbi:cation:proton antiporter [Methanobrevibacter sp. OttesenSCG-928-K11]|nr:cation:proton antiporter [Methanobrevibacter sp. OttesenSCG-928-K11]MDL2270916.1 cation:proton antiporter [Methanobrevibacter sp. OttesenSCG-928-I08]
MSVIIELIQSLLIIIAAILIIVASIGLLRTNKDLKNIIYARIHILGLVDIACIIAFIALDEILLGAIYFILMPFTAHAMANAFFKSDDKINNSKLENMDGKNETNPNIHPISEFKQSKNEENSFNENSDEKFTVSTLEIKEDDET